MNTVIPCLIFEIEEVGVFSGLGFHVGDVLADVLANERPLGDVGQCSNAPAFTLRPEDLR
jgi:hypothetical protein